MNPAISISGLSKRYRHIREARYRSFRDVIGASVKRLLRPLRGEKEYFWALKDVNFTIGEGDRIGIIGHNGAGKSTLLKIISRITPPTEGEVILNGRVASLLEVGTGFHPELTGRENIYLNGSILGLRKKEIDRKLDEIIDFSGVEKFIDTPLKNYSSGMQLRLAFSVAAHLEAEIILIDEVLAVGDMEFQKKCMGKMEEVSRQSGRTIVFVSHNMAAVKQLCNKGIVLREGEVQYSGTMQEALNVYTGSFLHSVHRTEKASFDLSGHPNKVRTGEGLMGAKLYMNGEPGEDFLPGGSISIKLNYFLNTQLQDPEIGIVIKDENYNPLIGLNNKHLGQSLQFRTGSTQEAWIKIPSLNVYTPGRYLVDLYFGDQYHFYECLYDAFEFRVMSHDVYSAGIELKPEWNRIFILNIEITA
jgi:lipopolysaccharide transport system ATP-binding protein